MLREGTVRQAILYEDWSCSNCISSVISMAFVGIVSCVTDYISAGG